MDHNQFEEKMRRRLEDEPITEVDWSMALAVGILRALEKRSPGFHDDVRRELEDSAGKMDADGGAESLRAQSLRELAASWVFAK